MKDEISITKVLLSIQRSLLGMIYPSIRGISVGFEGKKLIIIYYLDREPNAMDYGNISDVAGEVCADIDFGETEEICVFTKEPISKLDHLDSWVYIRKESQ